MTGEAFNVVKLTESEIVRVAALAEVLLPGDENAPAASAVDGFDVWIQRAVAALGSEVAALPDAIAAMPSQVNWDTVRDHASQRPEEFELLAVVASGAYFMSPEALAAIGYPKGERKAAPNDLVVDQLQTGVLDDVMARDPFYRTVTS